jgi:hypothetical protein
MTKHPGGDKLARFLQPPTKRERQAGIPVPAIDVERRICGGGAG